MYVYGVISWDDAKRVWDTYDLEDCDSFSVESLINEEIRVIQNYMADLRKAIALAIDTNERNKFQRQYDELGELLKEKLGQSDMG